MIGRDRRLRRRPDHPRRRPPPTCRASTSTRIYPLAGPIPSRARSPATRWRSSSSTSSCPTGAGPASSPASACCRRASSTEPVPEALRPHRRRTTAFVPGRAHADRAVLRHDGRAGRRHARRADPAAARGRRQHRLPPPHEGHDALPAGRRRRAACSRSATRTPPRATARSRSRASSARWRTTIPDRRSRTAWACARRRCGGRPGSLTPRVDGGGWFATTGVEPDLMEAARSAVRAMIDHLVPRARPLA